MKGGAALAAMAALLLALPGVVSAQQGRTARDTGRALILEHTFGSDSAGAVVNLRQKFVYRAVVTGPGDPSITPVRRGGRPAYLVPIGATPGEPRPFEVYPLADGPHSVTVKGLPAGATATLRLYGDTALTRRIEERQARAVAFGLMVDGGVHSGYRLDPTGGADPSGGSDLEACLLVATGQRLSTCLGIGRQHFPSARFTVTWLFLEERGRVLRTEILPGSPLDVGLAARFGAGLATGPRALAPELLAGGAYVAQHLSGAGRRGWSAFAAWEHGRLGYIPETERLDTDRFTAGLTWVP